MRFTSLEKDSERDSRPLEMFEEQFDVDFELEEVDLIELLPSVISEKIFYKIFVSKEKRKVKGVFENVRIPMYFNGRHYEEDNFRVLRENAKRIFLDYIQVNKAHINEDVYIKLKRNYSYRKMILKVIIKEFIENVPEVDEDMFIHPPHILNCLNGVIDMITGEFRRQTPDDLYLFVAGANYNPRHTELPTILNDSLLRTLGPNRQYDCSRYEPGYAAKRVESFKESMGYCCTQETSLRKCFCLIGEGSTGKSTILRYIQSLFDGYSGVFTRTALSYRRGSDPTINNDFVENRNKSFVSFSEMNEQEPLDDAPVKNVLGEDILSYRRTGCQLVNFDVKFKILMASNFFPKIRNLKDEALKGRFVVFQFLNGFTDEEKDPNFKHKLNEEHTRDQALSCFIHYAMKFYKNGKKINLHSSVEGDLAYYIMLQEDPVVNFVNNKVQFFQDENSAMYTKDIYRAFQADLYLVGYDKEVTSEKFSKRFKEVIEMRGIGEKVKSKNNLSAYKNLRIEGVPIYRIKEIRGQFMNHVNQSFLQGRGYYGEMELA